QVDDGFIHINNKTTFNEAETGGATLNLKTPGEYQCPPASSLTGTSRAERAAEMAAAAAAVAAHRGSDEEPLPVHLALIGGTHERQTSARRASYHAEVEEMRRGKALAIMRDWASRHGQLVPRAGERLSSQGTVEES
ncbi:unnamed protein product, partial [Symbiodinium pilosum]